MDSNELVSDETSDQISPSNNDSTKNIESCRTISQDLRFLDDALNHAIDQMKIFNSETMSDLSLKYELMRNNESRVIGFFAHQLILIDEEKNIRQNRNFHSEFVKLDRFLSVLNFNPKSVEFIVKRIQFDDLLNETEENREQLLRDAATNETERTDFYNALNALKDCIHYFSSGATNDNGRFFWHIETPTSTPSNHLTRQHRLSDTGLPMPKSTDNVRSTSVSSSVSTDFSSNHQSNGAHPINISSPQTRRNNLNQTPPPSRSNHLCVNGKGKCEHPSKKSFVDPSIFVGSPTHRNLDLHLPEPNSGSRRNSFGSENELRPQSGGATPKSPTVRSPTMSNSPMGSGQNSDVETDPRSPDSVFQSPNSPIFRQRFVNKIPHKWSNLLKLSTCNVCSKKIYFIAARCNICKYKCHKECVVNAPINCSLTEPKVRRAFENFDIQHVLTNSIPLTRKFISTASANTSPTCSTPISVPGSPAPNLFLPAYNFSLSLPHGNPSICVSESIYCQSSPMPSVLEYCVRMNRSIPQNDQDSWVVIETDSKTSPELTDSQYETDSTSTLHDESLTNSIDPNLSAPAKLIRQLSQSEPVHPHRQSFQSKLSISFDDDEMDPDKRSMNLSTKLQDWVIGYNNIKIIEEVKRSSGSLMKAHWHGELALRKIKPNPKTTEIAFLNQFKDQIFRLRKVRHEYLNLYTGICIEYPDLAIASSWIRGFTLFEIIHIHNESIPLNLSVQYAAQIAQAMSYLHEKSIFHQSLRTSNIFVENNRIVLTDYGLAPLSKCYRQIDDVGIVAPRGWLSYLAPEILRKLDPRDEESLFNHTAQTDVYAFGTVWYELLFREFPFAKQPAEYIIWRAGNSLKQPLSSMHISKSAKDIINQCWAFQPDDRPDFAMLCKSLTKMPGKRTLVRSPSTPLQFHGHQISNPFG